MELTHRVRNSSEMQVLLCVRFPAVSETEICIWGVCGEHSWEPHLWGGGVKEAHWAEGDE